MKSDRCNSILGNVNAYTHAGHGNFDVNYKLRDIVLSITVKEKDLGVTVSADMKFSYQCGIAVSKGRPNKHFVLFRRNITYKGTNVKAIVTPHLEYCIQACRLYRKKDIYIRLERIQRRAAKIISELIDRDTLVMKNA